MRASEKTSNNSDLEIRVIKRKPSDFDARRVYFRIEMGDKGLSIEGSNWYVGDDELAIEKAIYDIKKKFQKNKNVKTITVSVLPQEEWDI